MPDEQTRIPDSPGDAIVSWAVQDMREKGATFDLTPVPVPLGAGTVLMRPLGPVDRVKLYHWLRERDRSKQEKGAALVALSYCTTDGERLFDLDSVPLIVLRLDLPLLAALAEAATKLSRLGD